MANRLAARIIVSLLLVGGYGDIALRDFGALLGALTLARLAGADFSHNSSPRIRRLPTATDGAATSPPHK